VRTRVFLMACMVMLGVGVRAEAVPVGIRIMGDVTFQSSSEIASHFAGYIVWDTDASPVIVNGIYSYYPLSEYFIDSPSFTNPPFPGQEGPPGIIHVFYDSHNGRSTGKLFSEGGGLDFQFDSGDNGFGDSFDLMFLNLGAPLSRIPFPSEISNLGSGGGGGYHAINLIAEPLTVPEPQTWLLVLSGMVGIAVARWWSK